MTAPLLAEVVETLGLADDWIVAGRASLDVRVEDVRLHDGSPLSVGGARGLALVVTRRPDVSLELSLQGSRAAGAAAVFLVCQPEEVLASTRWLADRLELPVVACPGRDPLALAFDLKLAVAESDVALGMAAATASRQLRGRPCDPERAVRIVRDTLQVECAVLGADSIVLAGTHHPDMRIPSREVVAHVDVRPDCLVLAAPVSATPGPDLDPDFWLMARLPRVTRRHADMALAVMELISTGVTAWAALNRLEGQQDAALQGSVLMQVLTSGGTVPPHLLEQTLALGWSLNGWHLPVCVRPASLVPMATLDSMTDRVREAVRLELARAEVVRSGSGWLCWVSQRADPSPDELDGAVAAMHRVVAALAHRVVIGVGTPGRGAAGFIEGLVEAQALAGAAGRIAGRRVVEDARASAARRLVMAAVSGATVAAGSNRLLRPLLGSDEALLETLETFLALESSKAATATALHVHRNTVTKRLERIEQILGVDLDDPEVRLALELACRGRNDRDALLGAPDES